MNIWFNCISLQLFIFVCSGIHLSMMQVCQLDSIDNKHWRLSADQAKLHQCSLIHRKRDRKRTNVDQTCSQCVAGQRRPWTVGDTQRVVYVCVNGKRFFAKTCWPLTLWPIRWGGGGQWYSPPSFHHLLCRGQNSTVDAKLFTHFICSLQQYQYL